MNAGTSKRTNESPFGDESLPHVQLGNTQLGYMYDMADAYIDRSRGVSL